ncbi:PepSY domain-containing protein [[Flexibacter] sp. ATCC 35208]|uniref:PepSY domain-containing protein n=1 Tax=[Flexibacter] sp. ATCC 35208 TaxID=1936242 RepID=UPI0009D12EFC|nr:PepSY domain-containing protein [[Flexibacter] sp. ATCC 35208]OMP76288.1 hypothetical protein BW716_25765 [[Flexibacter] sp. ATCC 35208]
MKFKAILLIHRYLGFALSGMFVVWFLSGMMMMYVTYPTMKYEQRLQRLPVLKLEQCHIIPPQIKNAKRVRLGMLLDRPVYRIDQQVIYADNGDTLPGVDTALASLIATAFAHSKPASVEVLHEIDQWMAAHRSQGYLPDVYKFKMDDAAGNYVYVSMHTAEVVQMVNARQRLMAWLGPIPHWIYPTLLIRNRPLWSQVVIWVSLMGTIMCLAGIIMGFVRYKRKRGMQFSPYKKVWFKYHHYTGFIFGLFVFTWVLSGLFSMSPLPLGKNTKPKTTIQDNFVVLPRKFSDVKEIQLIEVEGKPYYLGWKDGQHTQLLDAGKTDSRPFERFDSSIFHIKGKKEILTTYDDYYYSRKYEKRLPVLRVKDGEIWSYIDLSNGQLVLQQDNGARVERWLYHGLHSLDFSFLVYKRPLWDVVVWILMLGGTMVSVTGAVLTWKWLKRKAGVR